MIDRESHAYNLLKNHINQYKKNTKQKNENNFDIEVLIFFFKIKKLFINLRQNLHLFMMQ